jgi:hypothetical protein
MWQWQGQRSKMMMLRGGGGGGNAMEQKIRSVKRWIRKDLAGGLDLFAFWKDIVAGRKILIVAGRIDLWREVLRRPFVVRTGRPTDDKGKGRYDRQREQVGNHFLVRP